jgi:Tfp pilus assembly protein PilV
MGTMRRWVRVRLVADESGMSIAEVLVSMFIFSFVLIAILNLLDDSTKIAANDTERPLAVREAQVGLHRMTREIRQASKVTGVTLNTIDFNVTINNQNWHVFYNCNAGVAGQTYQQCTRSAAIGDGSLSSPVVVIDRVLNGGSGVFSQFTPTQVRPKFFQVTIEVPSGGERSNSLPGNGGYKHSVVLDDGVYLRNLNLAN